MKILICGLGSIGQRHARNLIRLGFKDIYALRTRNWELSKELKSIKIVGNIDQALKLAPDIVLITNPTSLHLTYALPFANIGSDLFIEKPLDSSLKQYKQLQNLARKKKLIIMVGYNFRFHPQLIEIKKLIEKKEIGRLLTVNVLMGEYLPNWHPKEDYKQGYSARADLGGGVILTQSHDLDYLYWLFGDVATVNCSIFGKLSSLGLDVEETADITLKFKKNITGFLHLDYLQNPAVRQMTIFGTKGRIFWNYHNNFFELFKDGVTKRFDGDKKFNRNDMFINELKHFLSCVKNRKKPLIPTEEAKRIVEICLAAKQSALNDKKILLN